MSIYLDYAAATPMSDEVIEAMKPYFTEKFHNASATYLAGRSSRHELDEMRASAAKVLGARPAEIVFTAGATEANNLAISGVAAQFPEKKILISAIEHDSVLKPGLNSGAQIIPVNEKGEVDVASLKSLIDDKTVLISIMLVNNELGTLQPFREITALILEIRRQRLSSGNKLPLYLHADAAQAPNYMDLHVSRLGVDMMSINGGKIYGPKGAGLLYVKAGTKLQAVNVGGGQEFGLRSGTENLAGIAGLVKALVIAQERREEESRRITELRNVFEKELQETSKQISINGGARRAPHIISATFEGGDNETLMMKLDEAGVQVAVGSACSASSDDPSHVLKAIGLSDRQARSTLRFSLGRGTTLEGLKKTVETIAKLP